jgi:hypothetical protein
LRLAFLRRYWGSRQIPNFFKYVTVSELFFVLEKKVRDCKLLAKIWDQTSPATSSEKKLPLNKAFDSIRTDYKMAVFVFASLLCYGCTKLAVDFHSRTQGLTVFQKWLHSIL